LKDADHAIDIERDAQIRAIKVKYAAQTVAIIDALVDKEVKAITSKYDAERQGLIEELKKRGVEVEEK